MTASFSLRAVVLESSGAVNESRRAEAFYTSRVAPRVKAGFIPPMLLLRTDELSGDRARWQYELKFDGYRAIAFKTGGVAHLRSRNNHDFGRAHPSVLRGLATLPNETVVDGELVAFDEEGRP